MLFCLWLFVTGTNSRAHTHIHVQDAGVDLDTYDIKTILVDPPRAGEESADSRARRSIRILFLLAALSPCIPFGQPLLSACMLLCCALWSAERCCLYCAGLDAGSLELTKKYDEIVYISCNPAKLRAELDSFPDHKIVSAALFDQVCVPSCLPCCLQARN